MNIKQNNSFERSGIIKNRCLWLILLTLRESWKKKFLQFPWPCMPQFLAVYEHFLLKFNCQYIVNMQIRSISFRQKNIGIRSSFFYQKHEDSRNRFKVHGNGLDHWEWDNGWCMPIFSISIHTCILNIKSSIIKIGKK